jgi:lipopolysaccharide export LptBFGC system permease protein LptF
LKNVDLETALNEGGDGVFVSFEEWNKPLIFDLAQNSEPSNLKRLGITELLKFSSSENNKGAEAKILIHKSFALGTSSLFLSLVLLPLSIMQSKKETMANLAVGILFCILYFAFFTVLVEVSLTSFSPVLIWLPNLLCFIIGSYLLYNFEN